MQKTTFTKLSITSFHHQLLIFFVRLLRQCACLSLPGVVVVSTVDFPHSLRAISSIKQMSTNEHDVDGEAISDREKVHCRRSRRPSVQFIDKNLIRRRSSGLEKQSTYIQQVPRLPSINSNDELDTSAQQTILEPLLQREDCENLPRGKNVVICCFFFLIEKNFEDSME